VNSALMRFPSLCARVFHVDERRERSNESRKALSRNKIFLRCNRFFLQKDVAESEEARKVTPSF
jgi:hypothetical protein